jgi:hypothetical protein
MLENEYDNRTFSFEEWMEYVGFDMPINKFIRVCPGNWPDRLLFEYINDNGEQKVIKIRRTLWADKEADKFRLMENFFLTDKKIPKLITKYLPKNDFYALDMPWLGWDLKELVNTDSVPRIRFTENEIINLTQKLIKKQLEFADKYNLIHSDLCLGYDMHPNNIVFNPNYYELYLIDAENLETCMPRYIEYNEKEWGKITNWIKLNLMK